MKILIAGSSGIIGSNLFEALKQNYSIVTGIGYEKLSIANYMQVDLTNKNDIDEIVKKIEKPDVLIFLVALAHEKGKNKQLEMFRLINFNTLLNLLSSMEEYGNVPSKIIFTSTISVYGEKYGTNEYVEDCEKKPKSPYAVTKLEAEELLMKKYAEKSWILRFAPVYSKDFRLNIIRRTMLKDFYYCVGEGNNKLSLLNINNISEVIKAIIEEKVPAGIYNVSDNKTYSFNKLLRFQGAKRIIKIPNMLLKTVYYLNKITKVNFIEENAIKLLTNNIYPSTKIRRFVDLPYKISDM